MQLKSREVILLKPTPVFLSFLAGQLPEVVLPDLHLLQTDTTAYTLPLHETEDALLETLEKNFALMNNSRFIIRHCARSPCTAASRTSAIGRMPTNVWDNGKMLTAQA